MWRAASRLLVGAALLAGLSACQPTAETPLPVPDIPVVNVSPGAAPLALAWAQAYVAEEGPLPFDLVPIGSEAGQESVSSGASSLMLDFPPPPDGWFVTPLGWEAIAVIVDPAVPVRSLSIEDLAQAFRGEITNWSELGVPAQPLQVILPPAGDRFRQHFLDQVMPDGRVTTNARLAPSASAALDLVASTDGSLAIVPAHALPDGRVATVRIAGALPSAETAASGRYPLRVPALASAPAEPDTLVRQWLVWVQSRGAPAPVPAASTATPTASEIN